MMTRVCIPAMLGVFDVYYIYMVMCPRHHAQQHIHTPTYIDITYICCVIHAPTHAQVASAYAPLTNRCHCVLDCPSNERTLLACIQAR